MKINLKSYDTLKFHKFSASIQRGIKASLKFSELKYETFVISVYKMNGKL